MDQDPRRIWTLVDGDDGNMYIVDGYHLVNRVACCKKGIARSG